MSEPASILLTGAAGFVGRHLRAALARRYPAARRTAAVLPADVAGMEGWAVWPCDLADEAAVSRLVGESAPDLIVHLAAQASVAQAAGAAAATWRVNWGATFNLAAAVGKGASHPLFLYASTSEVYGESFRAGPATETTPLAPLNAYARSKAAAEAMLGDILGPEARLIVCRPFNHTGPGQDERFVIPAFAAQVARVEAGLRPPVIEVGDLSAKLDFLDVRDVVEAYLRLIDQAGSGPGRLTVNIASGRAIELAEVIEILRAHAGRPFEVRVDPARLRGGDARVSVGDAAKLRALTGWSPAHPIEETVIEVLEAFRAKYHDTSSEGR
ncbi:MAG: GDP-mannose 4,6-dehydratase [Caulobacteraceae bacterium]